MSDVQYFNFPIQLIDGIFKDKDIVLKNILNYALYSHSLKLDEQYSSPSDRFKKSAAWYRVSGITQKNFSSGRDLYDSIPDNSPKVGLEISRFWDYYKNEKSDFDIACLAAFLAIKSIIGTKPYCKITNAFLYGRMAGKRKQIEDIKELPPELLRYAKVYQTVKIKDELRLNWFLKHYSFHTKGYYVSFNPNITDYQLGQFAEKERKSNKLKKLKQHDMDIRKQIIEGRNTDKPP